MRLSHAETEERVEARAAEYKAGEISEHVFRASLFALRYRGDDIEFLVRQHAPAANGNAR